MSKEVGAGGWFDIFLDSVTISIKAHFQNMNNPTYMTSRLGGIVDTIFYQIVRILWNSSCFYTHVLNRFCR